MTFSSGNKAIRDHLKNGKELLLFEKLRHDGSVRFMGSFVYSGYEYREAPDTNKEMRQAIVFHLLPIEDFSTTSTEDQQTETSLAELRNRAYNDRQTTEPTATTNVKKQVFQRSAAVKAYARRRADGVCENCDTPALFTSSNGEPFLEVHHILRLSDGGPDRQDHVAAICPNCHRAAHHAENKQVINKQLLAHIAEKEASFGPA
ncbi:5-methylcytosine-specific restriction enzyme A [Marinobacter persicus]|uniref:5-methylcytosine-specific restriction enzyme A n=1 Tax=Marinobacter persicus TaxID=930118 RepID=A0A1I3R5J9_9GAMM|nr:HNH endonuclease signature motif containing protein [Marinobacter persicus]GHD43457.1 hypothetical protein GCM10008110_07420 [Marinobacter persicus]SFJ40711.1 5-methylcytosine-specific restriction enzyme A [Marinobacter persicus]